MRPPLHWHSNLLLRPRGCIAIAQGDVSVSGTLRWADGTEDVRTLRDDIAELKAQLAALTPVTAPSSLVGYWPFDADVHDRASGMSGTISSTPSVPGSATVSPACAYHGASGLELSGGFVDYGQPDALDFHGRDEITIMMWARGPASGQITSYFDPMSWHHGTRGIVVQSQGPDDAVVCAGSTGTGACFEGSNLKDGEEWQHIAWVRSAAGAIAYLNGVVVGTGGPPGRPIALCGRTDGVECPADNPNCECPITPNWAVWIGGDPHDRRYVGCIDEVKVFDAALSAAEVHEQVMPATPSAGPPRRHPPSASLIGCVRRRSRGTQYSREASCAGGSAASRKSKCSKSPTTRKYKRAQDNVVHAPPRVR